MISICLPTRGRPESFKRFCQSVLDNASHKDDIEFVVYRDNDDNSPYEYVGNYTEVRGERIILSAMWNECQKVAAGPIYMFAIDDIVFYTKGWDELVMQAFLKSDDKIMCVHPDDGNLRFGSRYGIVFFLHKNWVDTVGYLVPPYFRAECCDNWINDTAIDLGRKYFLREMVVKHFEDENQNDETHKSYTTHVRTAHAIYRLKTPERKEDVRKLEAFIRDFKHKSV